MYGKILVWLPMKGLISLILLLVRQVFRGDVFVSFFRQARDWHRKSAGGALVGMVCGAGAGKKCARRERARFLQLQRGGFKFCECGEEADKNFNTGRTLVETRQH